MPAPALSITQPKLILGEGIDEVRFFKALLAHLGIVDIQVTDYGGKTKLSDFLQTLPAVPGFTQLRSLMVTRDADASYAAAYQSVCDGLKNAGFPDPSKSVLFRLASQRFTFTSCRTIRMPGVWKTFVSPRFILIRDFMCGSLFSVCSASRRSKSDSFGKGSPSCLAGFPNHPDRRLGEAAEKGYWPWMVQAFQPLIRLIQSL